LNEFIVEVAMNPFEGMNGGLNRVEPEKQFEPQLQEPFPMKVEVVVPEVFPEVSDSTSKNVISPAGCPKSCE